MRLSLAGKALVLLPFAAVGGWSANAALIRMQRPRSGVGIEQLEFVVGSMDDTVMETLDTGDLIFFTRKLTALQPLPALYTWLMRRQYNPRFDHCGWIYVDKLGRKFVVEETLGKVQCRPYSARVLTSEATEIAILPLKTNRTKEQQDAAFHFVAENVHRASRVSIRHYMAALIRPLGLTLSSFPSEDQSLFPSAAFIVEAYEAMGLVDSDRLTTGNLLTTKATITPRQLLTRNNLHLCSKDNGGKAPTFGSLLPIRLL